MTFLVVLTQAAESGDPLARRLSAEGLQVARWPLVRLVPAATETLRPVLERLADFNWILLPSPSAVRLVAQRMKESGIEWPAGVRAGLVGPGSVEAFRDCFGDGPVVQTPVAPPHDAGHLIDLLDTDRAIRALVLNRPDGRTGWLDLLRRKAQSVEVVTAYTAEALVEGPPADLMWRLQRLQRTGGAASWVVGSASQLDTLQRALPADWLNWARQQPVLVPHVTIARHAREQGFENAHVYDDRQDLLQRIQYLANTVGQAPAEPADIDADNEEVSVLTLDQQKDSALAGAKPRNDPQSKGLGETKSVDAPVPAMGAGAATGAASSPSSVPAAELSGKGHVSQGSGSTAPTSGAAGPELLDPVMPVSATPVGTPVSATPVTSTPAASTPAASTPAASTPAQPAASATAGARPASATPTPATPPKATPTASAQGTGSAASKPADSRPTRLSEPPSPLPPPPPPPPPLAGGRRSGAVWPLLLLLLVGLLAGGGWWYMQQRFLAAERQGAQRIQEAEARAGRLEEQIKSLRDSQSQLQSRSSSLEAKIAQSATQQEQLAGLYEEIAKARGEGALAEVEQSVMMANQHLELTGNVQAALLAMQNAAKRLGESEQSQATAAQRLVLQDIERLKALPEVDLTRTASRLDEVINGAEKFPLLADAQDVAAPATPAAQDAATPANQPPVADAPSEPPASAPAATPASPDAVDQPLWRRLYTRVVDAGSRGLESVKSEFHSLVTIRRIDKPDSLLLSPEQKLAVRENLKLLLLNARLNLLNRHEELFRQDVGRAIDALQRLFDAEHPDVKQAIAALQGLQGQPLALNLPSLAESLAAVRAARAAGEKRS